MRLTCQGLGPALLCATEDGRLEELKELLHKGATVNFADEVGTLLGL